MPWYRKFSVVLMIAVVLAVILFLSFSGLTYYKTPMEERFFHLSHQQLKPSGVFGHGYGIAGSLFMIIGVTSYLMRKRMRVLSRVGVLSRWLEFHIFLCTLGPILVLFHTAFKFGGLVAVSFWSMVAVFISGIIGRFIYIQIPRTIEGRELNLSEVKALKMDLGNLLRNDYNLDESVINIIIDSTRKKISVRHRNIFSDYISKYFEDTRAIRNVKSIIRNSSITRSEKRKIVRLVRQEISLNRKIDRLTTLQKLFKYWHVAHLPFAFVMLIIMIIHVIVTIVFGYRWIL